MADQTNDQTDTLALLAKLAQANQPSTVPGAIGSGLSNLTQATGQNRLNQEQLALSGNAQNIEGQAAFEQELMNRAKMDNTQRQGALADLYRMNFAQSGTRSPFDPNPPSYSPQYMGALSTLASSAQSRLANPSPYAMGGGGGIGGSATVPGLQPYQSLNIKDIAAATGNSQSTLDKVAQAAGAGGSILDKILKALGKGGGGSSPGGGKSGRPGGQNGNGQNGPGLGPYQSDNPFDPSNAQDPANYDDNGNYIGPGAYDADGNWVDPYGQGWQGDTNPGDPFYDNGYFDPNVDDNPSGDGGDNSDGGDGG